MGMLVAADAGSDARLAWSGALLAAVLLAVALLAASPAGVQCSLALLAALLLVRTDDRLLLAPLYGACLLLVSELGQRSIDLRGLERIGRGLVGASIASIMVLAAVGCAAAAAAATAVTVAPARSVAFTALGTLAVLSAFMMIVLIARRAGNPSP